jgi:hypothetical protein
VLEQRLDEELTLIRTRFPSATRHGRWFSVPDYPTGSGWSAAMTHVAFLAHEAHPGTGPYGIYVPAGLKYKGATPSNYSDSPAQQPPFGGSWGMFSWESDSGEWRATADLKRGANLLNWVIGFAERFRAGA